MSFSTGKDLRKPVPKRGAKSKSTLSKTVTSSSSTTVSAAVASDVSNDRASNDIVEIAKKERQQRENKRSQIKSASIIQAYWRRRFGHQLRILKTLYGRIEDIEKINAVFVSQKKPPLKTPSSVSQQLLMDSLFLLLHWRGKTNLRPMILKICKLVIQPSINDMNSQKTDPELFSQLSIFVTVKFCCQSIRLFARQNKKPTENKTDSDSIILLFKTVQAFSGQNETRSNDLEDKYKFARKLFLRRKGFFSAVRALFLSQAPPFLSLQVEDHFDFVLKKKSALIPGSVSKWSDLAFDCCRHLFAADYSTLSGFTTSVFTIPLLTTTLSEDCLRSFSTDPLFLSLLAQITEMVNADFLVDSVESTGPMPFQVISRVRWLTGNITSLLPFLLSVSPEWTGASDEVLESFLRRCRRLLLASRLPLTIWQGRESIVWQREGVSLTAVPIPPAFVAQVRSLLHTESVRGLYEQVLRPLAEQEMEGNRTDEEQEVDWTNYRVEADVREVEEAMVSTGYRITHGALTDHQEASRWFTAKWAAKLTSSIGTSLGFNMFSSTEGGKGNTSKGKDDTTSCKSQIKEVLKRPGDKKGVSRGLLGNLLSLWVLLLPPAAGAIQDSLPMRSLTVMAFSLRLVRPLWVVFLASVQGKQQKSLPAKNDLNALVGSFTINDKTGFGHQSFDGLICLVTVLRITLIALESSELYELQHPLPLHQMLRLIRCLRGILFKIIRKDPSLTTEKTNDADSNNPKDQASNDSSEEGFHRQMLQSVARMLSAVLSNLYTRWARRPFSLATVWEQPEAQTAAVISEVKGRSAFGVALLRVMPWSLNFHERMKLLRMVLDEERLAVQGSNDTIWQAAGGFRSRGTVVTIRRTRLLEDGMSAFAKIGATGIKDRVVVRYVDEFGTEESGIDAGGLFKDFLTDLSAITFDPSYGLFSLTADQLLFPNPAAGALFDRHEMEETYQFLGRVLGKALFENITLQPRFAHFFLAFMHGKYNFMNLIDDLACFDPELYKNLMFLKSYDGDVADLGLTFSVTDNSLGVQKEVELLPGGSHMDVDSQNRHRYVNLVAKYYLHDRLRSQAGAFFSGLYQVVHPDLLSLFCPPELQIIISGSQGGVSIEDFKRNTRYAGGYLSVDRHMTRFWAVLEGFSQEEMEQLLRFVTSCERPPSLGFSSLQPPFTIQRVECSDDTRLPSASTCFNILKLPTYSSQKVLKLKLLQAIQSKSGFGLS